MPDIDDQVALSFTVNPPTAPRSLCNEVPGRVADRDVLEVQQRGRACRRQRGCPATRHSWMRRVHRNGACWANCVRSWSRWPASHSRSSSDRSRLSWIRASLPVKESCRGTGKCGVGSESTFRRTAPSSVGVLRLCLGRAAPLGDGVVADERRLRYVREGRSHGEGPERTDIVRRAPPVLLRPHVQPERPARSRRSGGGTLRFCRFSAGRGRCRRHRGLLPR